MTNVNFYRNEHLPFLEAKRCARSDLAYQKHFHEEYSIGLIDEGETEAWCDGRAYRVETVRAISFPPGMLHACRPASLESWKYTMLFIKPEWLEQLEPAMSEPLRIPFLLEGRKNQYCRRLINRVADALAGTDEPLAAESAVELIYALASRNTLDLEHPSGSGSNSRTSAEFRNNFMLTIMSGLRSKGWMKRWGSANSISYAFSRKARTCRLTPTKTC
ncbi:AraC family ligand binding domain-containing protein [Paenibacillus sp. VCA1]|uniref:AraC family ligand binding domain-containing protein n=1 Tax=Paenibacillus sp. VCA1 TaxID=3039148 RepID=UPI002872A3F2|nr:AraC family ligand binding domain-containing protein [Paenibacillus sp. VCA1]MDR9852152.1 AraC family ligand binding domain-containing protein [Paenibacillus sp. VCA1]